MMAFVARVPNTIDGGVKNRMNEGPVSHVGQLNIVTSTLVTVTAVLKAKSIFIGLNRRNTSSSAAQSFCPVVPGP